MSLQLIIKPLAEKDLTEAYTWYNQQKPGLGDDLLTEIESCLDTILKVLYNTR